MSVNYNADEYGRFTIGARNLTDEIAELNEELRDGLMIHSMTS